ncbi:hypothetical protein C5L14_01855 [Labrys okinawensis]|uniref:Type III secretion protein n=1 Tax=Labrys okinawensis TaxID=346911 RepID=A0A2S9QJ28_9HYPH|nr:hypothetical protein [Labrys okinawensis]PRH89359.1 hypothetical protein C5L14_01855 [Labrys okinawensis]
MTSKIDAAEAWRSFVHKPALHTIASRLAPCFGGTLGDEACAHMLTAERLEPRLSRLIGEHYGFSAGEAQVDEEDRAIALCDAERLADLALKAGAIYWAVSFAGVIRRETTAALHARLGEALCEYAVLNRDLAGPEQVLEPIADLAERVAADGWRCLGAWCDAMPAGVGVRVRLKLPPSPDLDGTAPAPFAQLGPPIVRRAAGSR